MEKRIVKRILCNNCRQYFIARVNSLLKVTVCPKCHETTPITKPNRQHVEKMKSQFIQDVEAFANQMAERLPVTREGGIIIMATDNNDVVTCIIATNPRREDLVKCMLANNDLRNDIFKVIEELQ